MPSGETPWTVVRAHLEVAARRKGWRVIVEPLDDDDVRLRPGACTLRGERRIYLDASAGDEAAARALAAVLEGEELEDVYLVPAARALVEARGSRSGPSPAVPGDVSQRRRRRRR